MSCRAPFIAAAFISSTVQVGCNWRNKAMIPAMCGAAIEVPFRISAALLGMKPVPLLTKQPDDGATPVHVTPVWAEVMLTPGAVMSGFNCAGDEPPRGPREEKLATRSA